MPLRILEEEIVFSSGRTCYANAGIIGLNPDLVVFEGYDGMVPWPVRRRSDPQLTVEDMRELVDHMIDRWQRLKEMLPTESTYP